MKKRRRNPTPRKRLVRIKTLITALFGMCGTTSAWAISAAQADAFRSANSGVAAITAAQAQTFFAGLVGAIAIAWCAWVIVAAYRSWGTGRSSVTEPISQVLRAFAVMIITLLVVS